MYAWSECMHGVQEGSPKIFEKLCILTEPFENKAMCVCLENQTNGSMTVNVPSKVDIVCTMLPECELVPLKMKRFQIRLFLQTA